MWGRGDNASHNQVTKRTVRASSFLPPTQPTTGKQGHIITRASEAFMWQRVFLGSVLLPAVMEFTAALPMPCWAVSWLRTKNLEILSTKPVCPLAAHHTEILLCSNLKHQVRIPKGCSSHLVGINVAVGNDLSTIPIQQDNVLPNLSGLVLFGDNFLFSQGVTYEETQNHTESGLEGTF